MKRSRPWCVQVDPGLYRHKKSAQVCRETGLSPDEFAGKLLRVFGYLMQVSPDGVVLEPGDIEADVASAIELACGWQESRGRGKKRREPGTLWKALRAAGFIDRQDDGALVWHNWEEINFWHFRRASERTWKTNQRTRSDANYARTGYQGRHEDAFNKSDVAQVGEVSPKKFDDLENVSSGHPVEVQSTLGLVNGHLMDMTAQPGHSFIVSGGAAVAVSPDPDPEIFTPQPTNQPQALPSFDRAPPKRARSLESVVVPAPFGWLVGWENENEKTDREVAATYLGDVMSCLRHEGVAVFAMHIAEGLRPIAVDGDVLRVSIAEGQLGDYLEFVKPFVDDVMVKRLDTSWATPDWKEKLDQRLQPKRMEVVLGHKQRPALDVPMMERVWHEARSARGIMPAPFDAKLAQAVLTEAQTQGHHRNGVLAFALAHFIFDDGVKAPGKPFATFARPKVYRDRLDVKLAARAGWFFEEKREEQLTGVG